MNIKKIQHIVKEEEKKYFNTKKDYSEFSKHFSFKPFFERNGIEALFASFFAAIFTIPANLQIFTILGLNHDLPLRFFLTLSIFLLVVISPLFISYFTNKIINHNRFFKTQKNMKEHEEYIENKMVSYFDDLTISQ